MKKGFTLIELLVVIAIIGILASVLIASFEDAKSRSNPEAEYKICNAEECYNVESYTKEQNCVFMAEYEVRMCGDYTITKLNPEE